jgi:hypothetical protein
MDALIIVMRIVHIFCGVFWAGTIFFIVLFLQPAIKASGPAGGQVMQRLVAARVLTIVPVFALLTVLSGLWLIWRVSGGGSAEWMGSRHGIALSIGGASAILGFALGLTVMRPSTLRAMAIGQAAQAAGGPPTPEQQAQMQALQKRARSSAVGVAHLLAIAVIAMAVARYL